MNTHIEQQNFRCYFPLKRVSPKKLQAFCSFESPFLLSWGLVKVCCGSFKEEGRQEGSCEIHSILQIREDEVREEF